MAGKDKGGGARKYDRNRKSAQNSTYKAEKRHEKSRIRQLDRHLRNFPKDEMAHAIYASAIVPFAPSELRRILQ